MAQNETNVAAIPGLPAATPTLRLGSVSGDARELGKPLDGPLFGVREPRSAERDAILESLYEERSSLLREKRSGGISAASEEYLAELNEYIDEWEAAEDQQAAANTTDVWQRLDALAASLLDVQAKIERQHKK